MSMELPRGDDTGLDPEIKDLEVEETWIDPRYPEVFFDFLMGKFVLVFLFGWRMAEKSATPRQHTLLCWRGLVGPMN